jgi:crossover junction endodeoxyribonuclease RuvC
MGNFKTILGIDPGFARTGYGVIKTDGHTTTMVDYGCIETTPQQRFTDRLQIVHDSLREVIAQHHPDVIALEELFFAKNAKTALQVGHARGVILLTVMQAKVPMMEFTPLQVKQALTSYGRADKEQVQKMVTLLLRLKEVPQPDDAADALAIALCGAMHQSFHSLYEIR